MLATLNAIIGCNRRCSVRHQRASDQCVFTWLVPFRIVKEICWLAIPAFSKSSFIQFLIISNAVVFCLLAFLFSLVDCFTSFTSFASYFISYLSGFLLILATIDRMSSFYSWIVPHRFGRSIVPLLPASFLVFLFRNGKQMVSTASESFDVYFVWVRVWESVYVIERVCASVWMWAHCVWMFVHVCFWDISEQENKKRVRQ